MTSAPITLKELPEAVQAYFDLKGTDHFSGLMDLIQEQTPYIQKRYFNMVEALRVQREKKFEAPARHTTIAEYSADPHNPWHSWLIENCTYGQHMFIMKAVKLSRLRDENRCSLAMMHDNLEMMVRHHDLDRDAAYDKWSEYETFKVQLTEYREAVLRAKELGAK